MPDRDLSSTVPAPSQLSRRKVLGATLLAGGAAAVSPLFGGRAAAARAGLLKSLFATTAEIGQITVALPGSLSSLDPATEGGILNYYVASISGEGLLGIDGNGALVPAIAEAWSQPDNTTYVFDLNPAARFQDGTPVTVDDVLASIELVRDPARSPSSGGYWPDVESIEQTGEHQLTITLPEPNVSFIWIVTNAGALWVTSRAFIDEHDPIGTAQALTLGTGPYRAVTFRPDSHAVFERTDTWWGGVPPVETIRFDFIPDENTRLLARRAGDIDVALNVPLDQLDAWESLADTDVHYTPDHSYVGLIFNQNVAPFDDIHVRKAIAHATDREATVASILRGRGEVALGVPTPEQLAAILGEDEAWDLLASITQYDFDLELAAAELAQSSVPGGFAVELKYPNTGPQLGRAALALSANLAAIGIDLTVTEVPIESWFTSLSDETAGLHFNWYFATTGDPGEVISWYLRDGNPYGYVDAEVTGLFAAAQAEIDDAARANLLIEANRRAADALALWPLWWGQSATAFASNIEVADYTPFFFLGVWPAHVSAG